jgi:hypothetical protein
VRPDLHVEVWLQRGWLAESYTAPSPSQQGTPASQQGTPASQQGTPASRLRQGRSILNRMAQDMPLPLARYTGIWHGEGALESRWMRELFGPYLREEVIDPDRTLMPEHAILFEHFANAQDPAYFAKFRGRDAILVDLSDENYEFRPEMYTNFRGVVRPYWSDVFRAQTVFITPLGPTTGCLAPTGPGKPASQREFAWSFLGQVNKSSRPDAMRALSRIEPHLFFATDSAPGFTLWNRTLDGQPRRYDPAANSRVMAETIFSPCPMGNTNLECFRLYESLEYGSIPLVETRATLDYFTALFGPHPLPGFRSWTQAAAFAASMLAHPEACDKLQQECVEWWATYKVQTRDRLGEFLAQRSADQRLLTTAELFTPRHRQRGFAARELFRHHDVHALGRRVRLMLARVFSGRKLRIHSGARPGL